MRIELELGLRIGGENPENKVITKVPVSRNSDPASLHEHSQGSGEESFSDKGLLFWIHQFVFSVTDMHPTNQSLSFAFSVTPQARGWREGPADGDSASLEDAQR